MPTMAFIAMQVGTQVGVAQKSRTRWSRRSASRLVLRLLLPTAAVSMGCDQHRDERAEARTLMTSLNAVSDEGTFARRSAALERLGRLPLHVESHVQTREVCRTAHEALLEAETAQAQARRSLDTSIAMSPKAIAADIERSTKALATARLRFPECEHAMRELLRAAH